MSSASQVEVDLAVAHLGQELRRPGELVGILREQLGHDIEPGVALRVELLHGLPAKRRSHARRGDEGRIAAVECAEAHRVNPAEHVSRDPLHGGERQQHRANLASGMGGAGRVRMTGALGT